MSNELLSSSHVMSDQPVFLVCLILSRRGRHYFCVCVVQDKSAQLVIKDPGEILEPQECLERTVRQDTLGSQVRKGVQGRQLGRGSCGERLPGSFHGR